VIGKIVMIDSTETLEMMKRHQTRLVHNKSRSEVLYELHSVKCS